MPSYNISTSEVDFEFTYPSVDDPLLAKVKAIANISINSAATELEQIKAITGYVHNLFTHNDESQPSANDPLTIIQEARAGKSFRCLEYSLLATALLWAYGIPARTIGLKTSDVETREYGAGHVVIEYWSNELGKWTMCDVQWGIIPMANGVLLSALELSEKVSQNMPVNCMSIDNSRFSVGNMATYIKWIKEYLYFFDTPIEITFVDRDIRRQHIAMLVPLNTAPPKIFQKSFKMNAVYGHSVLDFYLAPF